MLSRGGGMLVIFIGALIYASTPPPILNSQSLAKHTYPESVSDQSYTPMFSHIWFFAFYTMKKNWMDFYPFVIRMSINCTTQSIYLISINLLLCLTVKAFSVCLPCSSAKFSISFLFGQNCHEFQRFNWVRINPYAMQFKSLKQVTEWHYWTIVNPVHTVKLLRWMKHLPSKAPFHFKKHKAKGKTILTSH